MNNPHFRLWQETLVPQPDGGLEDETRVVIYFGQDDLTAATITNEMNAIAPRGVTFVLEAFDPEAQND